ILLSAAGKRFDQRTARRLAQQDRAILICGRYEGVDERVAEHLATDELSIGDFVLSGGELPAALIIDAVTRLLPGALGNEASSQNDSFSLRGGPSQPQLPLLQRAFPPQIPLLFFPHHARPAVFRGWTVPEALTGAPPPEAPKGRPKKPTAKPRRNRPDLLAGME